MAIVIAIVGIVAAISIPNLGVMLNRMRLNGAAVQLERSIGIAKKMSVANRMRHCIQFTSDAGHADSNSDSYLIGVTMLQETGTDTGIWAALTEPPELVGWSNDSTTELYKSISLESDTTTTTAFATTEGCSGLLFNSSGYLSNATADFAFPCNGANCAKLTLRNKAQRYVEQRALWVDPGGNVRTTVAPHVLPPLGP
ncbi:MAG: hypothetical protein GY898_25995 [Proteobacteria bacterium]|nr:hypothetical protein [Pseudomonadota bacterium]